MAKAFTRQWLLERDSFNDLSSSLETIHQSVEQLQHAQSQSHWQPILLQTRQWLDSLESMPEQFISNAENSGMTAFLQQARLVHDLKGAALLTAIVAQGESLARNVTHRTPPLAFDSAIRLGAMVTLMKELPCKNVYGYIKSLAEKALHDLIQETSDKLLNQLIEAHYGTSAQLPNEMSSLVEAMDHLVALSVAARDTLPDCVLGNTFLSTFPPLAVLIQPLKERFQFHFMQHRETHRLDKPDWWLAYLTARLREALPWFEKLLGSTTRLKAIPLRESFMKSIQSFVSDKWQCDRVALLEQPALLVQVVRSLCQSNWHQIFDCPTLFSVSIGKDEEALMLYLTTERRLAEQKFSLLEKESKQEAFEAEIQILLKLKEIFGPVQEHHYLFHSQILLVLTHQMVTFLTEQVAHWRFEAQKLLVHDKIEFQACEMHLIEFLKILKNADAVHWDDFALDENNWEEWTVEQRNECCTLLTFDIDSALDTDEQEETEIISIPHPFYSVAVRLEKLKEKTLLFSQRLLSLWLKKALETISNSVKKVLMTQESVTELPFVLLNVLSQLCLLLQSSFAVHERAAQKCRRQSLIIIDEFCLSLLEEMTFNSWSSLIHLLLQRLPYLPAEGAHAPLYQCQSLLTLLGMSMKQLKTLLEESEDVWQQEYGLLVAGSSEFMKKIIGIRLKTLDK